MGWRNAMIISIALPFAILTAATLMWISKKSINPEIAINNMTLFAVILVVGMVVDGAINLCQWIFGTRPDIHWFVHGHEEPIVAVGSTVLNQSGQSIEVVMIWMTVYLTISLTVSVFMNWFNAKMALVER